MHIYGKIGCFSFVVAFILQLCTTLVVDLYLRPSDIPYYSDIPQGKRTLIELHYLTVSSCVLLAICCLISKKWCQDHIHQVRLVLMAYKLYVSLHISNLQIVWRSLLLGVTQGFGTAVSLWCSENYRSLGW